MWMQPLHWKERKLTCEYLNSIHEGAAQKMDDARYDSMNSFYTWIVNDLRSAADLELSLAVYISPLQEEIRLATSIISIGVADGLRLLVTIHEVTTTPCVRA